MADHTPGPWEIQRYTVNANGKEVSSWSCDGLSIKTRVVDRSGTRVADCHWTDAHLIASAPDLLAACKAIEVHLCDTHPVTDNEHPYLTAVRQLRAAIARAEGWT